MVYLTVSIYGQAKFCRFKTFSTVTQGFESGGGNISNPTKLTITEIAKAISHKKVGTLSRPFYDSSGEWYTKTIAVIFATSPEEASEKGREIIDAYNKASPQNKPPAINSRHGINITSHPEEGFYTLEIHSRNITDSINEAWLAIQAEANKGKKRLPQSN